MLRHRSIIGGLAAGVLAVGLFAGTSLAVRGRSDGPTPASPPVRPIAFAPVTADRPAPIPPAAALRQARIRMPGGAVTRISVGHAPAGPPSVERVALPWIYATVKVPSLRFGLDVEPLWEADLLEGATVERSGVFPDAHDDLGGATFVALLPGGRVVQDEGAGIGDVALGQRFAAGSDSRIVSSLHAVLAGAGLRVAWIRVLHPLGPAPAVSAVATNPDRVARGYSTLVKALFGAPPRYEGYYIELKDARGNPIVRASASFRTGAGRCWVAPRYVAVTTLVCGS
jgi:hypothetical protein